MSSERKDKMPTLAFERVPVQNWRTQVTQGHVLKWRQKKVGDWQADCDCDADSVANCYGEERNEPKGKALYF